MVAIPSRAMLAGVARIAIIGGGSIGEALLSGLLRSGRQAKDMVIAERHRDRAKYLSETYSVLVTTVADAAENAAYVIVAVKPSDVELVIGDIAEAAARAENSSAEQVFVTVAAGVSTAYYEANLPAGSPVIRVMPNAPVVVGGGVSALAAGRFATADQLKEVSAIFDAVGGVRLGARLLLPDGGGARRRRGRGGVVPSGGHGPRGADDGRLGGDVAGEPRSGQPVGGRRHGHRDGHQPRPAAGHRDLTGWHHRRWSAGIGARWPSRRGCRGRRGGKNTL